MPISMHINEQIINTVLRIEEHVFHKCKIINCRLFYDGGPFEWVETSFENCQWSFRDEASNTVRLLQTIGLLKVEQTPPTNLSTSTTVH